MSYLEDTLAEQCLSKTLYPNTKIIVSRKKVEGTLLTYTNELNVKVDFSDVDPNLLENSTNIKNQSANVLNETLVTNNSDINDQNLDKSTMKEKTGRFFKKNN